MSQRPAKLDAQPGRRRGTRNLYSDLDNVMRLVRELESKTSSLPTVSEDGTSECRFAEELYAAKEEVEEKLMECERELGRSLEYLDEEVACHRRSLAAIGMDITKLKLKETVEEYWRAEAAERDQYHRAMKQRDATREVLTRAEAALRAARARKYPGRKPRAGLPGPAPLGYLFPGPGSRVGGALPPAPSIPTNVVDRLKPPGPW